METKMPIRAAPFKHQQQAFEFCCRLFGLAEGGEDDDQSKMRDLQKEVPKIPVANQQA